MKNFLKRTIAVTLSVILAMQITAVAGFNEGENVYCSEEIADCYSRMMGTDIDSTGYAKLFNGSKYEPLSNNYGVHMCSQEKNKLKSSHTYAWFYIYPDTDLTKNNNKNLIWYNGIRLNWSMDDGEGDDWVNVIGYNANSVDKCTTPIGYYSLGGWDDYDNFKDRDFYFGFNEDGDGNKLGPTMMTVELHRNSKSSGLELAGGRDLYIDHWSMIKTKFNAHFLQPELPLFCDKDGNMKNPLNFNDRETGVLIAERCKIGLLLPDGGIGSAASFYEGNTINVKTGSSDIRLIDLKKLYITPPTATASDPGNKKDWYLANSEGSSTTLFTEFTTENFKDFNKKWIEYELKDNVIKSGNFNVSAEIENRPVTVKVFHNIDPDITLTIVKKLDGKEVALDGKKCADGSVEYTFNQGEYFVCKETLSDAAEAEGYEAAPPQIKCGDSCSSCSYERQKDGSLLYFYQLNSNRDVTITPQKAKKDNRVTLLIKQDDLQYIDTSKGCIQNKTYTPKDDYFEYEILSAEETKEAISFNEKVNISLTTTSNQYVTHWKKGNSDTIIINPAINHKVDSNPINNTFTLVLEEKSPTLTSRNYKFEQTYSYVTESDTVKPAAGAVMLVGGNVYATADANGKISTVLKNIEDGSSFSYSIVYNGICNDYTIDQFRAPTQTTETLDGEPLFSFQQDSNVTVRAEDIFAPTHSLFQCLDFYDSETTYTTVSIGNRYKFQAKISNEGRNYFDFNNTLRQEHITGVKLVTLDKNGNETGFSQPMNKNSSGIWETNYIFRPGEAYAVGDRLGLVITTDKKIAGDNTTTYQPIVSDITIKASDTPADLWISSTEEFKSFMQSIADGNSYAGKTVVLTADIDLNNALYNTIWSETTPLSVCFRGCFNGNGHTIRGLNDETSASMFLLGGGGLFRVLNDGAEVKKLNIENPHISCSSTSGSCGALAGKVLGKVTISNVTVSGGEVNGANYVGGLIGSCFADAEITNCSNSATVTATGTNGVAGGIVGFLGGESNPCYTVTNCNNSGNITGGNDTGGIAGKLSTHNNYHNFSGCTNTGKVTSSDRCAAGIVAGSVGGGNFTNCENTGYIFANTHAGGILGWNEDDPIDFSGSINKGNIKGSCHVGGIAGYLGNKSLSPYYIGINCQNYGQITGGEDTGGIVGKLDTDNWYNDFSESINYGTVKTTSGENSAGGIIGASLGGGNLMSCTNSGSVSGPGNSGGILGYNENDPINFSDSKNSGTITSTGNYAGGIAACLYSKDKDPQYKAENCVNDGDVVGYYDTAGIVGHLESDASHKFAGCINRGNIELKYVDHSVGGIVGGNFGGGDYTYCQNYGKITAPSRNRLSQIIGWIEDDSCDLLGCELNGSLSCTETITSLTSGTTYTTDTIVNLDRDQSLHGVTIKAGMTIKLNGHRLTLDSSTQRMFTIGDWGALRIEGPGDIYGGDILNEQDGAFLSMNSSAYAVTLDGGVEITSFKTKQQGGAVIVRHGVLNLRDVGFNGCSTEANSSTSFWGDGGAIFVYGGDHPAVCKMEDDSEIWWCEANGSTYGYGGAVCVSSGGQFYMTGGTIGNCTANKGGGAIFARSSNSIVSLTGGNIFSNSVPAGGYYGGGVFFGGDVKNENVTLGGSVYIKGNKVGDEESNLHFLNNSANGTNIVNPDGMNVGFSLAGNTTSKQQTGSGRISKIDPAYADYAKYFVPDAPGYLIKYNRNGQYLELIKPTTVTLSSGASYSSNSIVNLTGDQSLHGVTVTDTMTLNLNGHTLTLDSSAERMFTVSGNGSLRVIGPGTIKGNTTANTQEGAFIYMTSPDTISLEGGVVIDGFHTKKRGGAISIINGTLNLIDATVQNCSANSSVASDQYGNGGAFYVRGTAYPTTFNMTGGTIQNCSANNSVCNSFGAGGGVSIECATFKMTDGTIQNCTAKNFGGGIHIGHSGSHVRMTGGKIINNSIPADSKYYGGGVFMESVSDITLGGSLQITGNKMNNTNSNLHLLNLAARDIHLVSSNDSMNVGISITDERVKSDAGIGRLTTASSGYESYVRRFNADNAAYQVRYNTDEQYLEIAKASNATRVSVASVSSSPDTKYYTLETALEKAQSGDTVSVNKNCSIIEPITIDKELIIDLCGNTVSGEGEDFRMFTIESGGKLTIKSDSNGQGILSGVAGDISLCSVESGGQFALENVVVSGFAAETGGAVSVDGGLFNMNTGVLVMECTALNGGAVAVNNGTFNMNDGSVIRDCYAENSGGAVLIQSSGTFNMNNGSMISHCAAKDQDEAVCNKEGTFNMAEGAVISYCYLGEKDSDIIETPDPEMNPVKPSSGDSSSKTVVTVIFETNGGNTISKLTLDKNSSLGTLPVPVREGYTFAGWYLDKALTNAVSDGYKVTQDSTLYAKWTQTEQPTEEGFSFTDVHDGDYFYQPVVWALENQVTAGTDASHFSPNDICTRAQMLTFLWRAAGSPVVNSSCPFTDVPADSYYYNAVLWGCEKGITKGTSETTFSPDDTVTRAQVVTLLFRYENGTAGSENPFTDVAQDAYYYDAVLWAVANHITEGTSATTFSPDNGCTRGQIVTFLYRDFTR